MKTVMQAIAILFMLASVICVILHISVWDWAFATAGIAAGLLSYTKYRYD